MTSHSNLGQQLEKTLTEKGMTKIALAKRMGTTPTQVTRWSKSESLQWHVIQKICAALEVSPAAFLGVSDDAP